MQAGSKRKRLVLLQLVFDVPPWFNTLRIIQSKQLVIQAILVASLSEKRWLKLTNDFTSVAVSLLLTRLVMVLSPFFYIILFQLQAVNICGNTRR